MGANRITIPSFHRVTGKTTDGRNIRNHVLYQGGASVSITMQDISRMRGCDIRHVVDLRSDRKCYAHAYQLSDAFISRHMSALETGDRLENLYFFILIDENLTVEDIKRAASSIYEGCRILPFHNPALALSLNPMETDDGTALLYRSSGKNRTGIPAALLQKMLGVREDIVMQECLLSNAYILPDTLRHAKEPEFQRDTRDMPVYCCSVHGLLLCSSFDEVERRYPGWEEFPETEYGVNEKRIRNLKKHYLES